MLASIVRWTAALPAPAGGAKSQQAKGRWFRHERGHSKSGWRGLTLDRVPFLRSGNSERNWLFRGRWDTVP